MKSLDYWRLCDELNITQAALLMIGLDPSGECQYLENWQPHERPDGYEAVKVALKAVINSKKVTATIRYEAWERGWNAEPNEDELLHEENKRQYIFKQEPDWNNTTISVDSLKKWLASKGFTTGFFFPDTQHNLPYLDSSHPQYAPKLAVAVMAWEEVTNNPYLLKSKSPKKALEAWLELNAPKFELTKQAIEEIAKIANWNTKGGAPSTPSPQANTGSIPEHEVEELDDEIPF